MSKLLQCKACGKEVAKGARCPSCGKDSRSFFAKHKILTGIIVLAVIGAFASMGQNSDKSNMANSNNTNATSDKSESKDTTVKYKTGKYLVGEDIESGLYRATITDPIMKMGYIERAKDVSMGIDSIIANIVITGNGYVEILDTDVAVKLQGVEIEPINLEKLSPNLKEELTDGIYLVGYDLTPGTYKVEVTDTTTGIGYVERSKSVAMGVNDIIANEALQGPGYVEIKEGDFAVRLQGVKLTLKK
ncbi:hypothetical protein SH2C18_03440 [Clostridium sediminicola]|uniref:hypothetical protein n=1 Tax=Clostridium sediminicola TaxID=3114879 RepID=UPI0031F234AC